MRTIRVVSFADLTKAAAISKRANRLAALTKAANRIGQAAKNKAGRRKA